MAARVACNNEISFMHRMATASEQRRNQEVWALLAVALTAGLIHLIGTLPFGRGFEMVRIARNIAARGAFANPFDSGPTGFTAVNPPLYPLMLAALFKLLGNETVVACAAAIGNVAANAATALLLPGVSAVLFRDRVPGIIASIGCLAAMQILPAWDTSFTILGTVLFCLLSASMIKRGGGAMIRGAVGGLGAGALVLLNPASLLVMLPWIGWLATRRRALASCAAVAAGLCFVVSIWVMRNDLRLGAPVLRTNFGMTIYASNNDCSAASLREAQKDGCYESHHPNTNPEEAELLRTLGEVRYDQLRTADTIAWIRSHPGRFSRLTLARVREFWFPSSTRTIPACAIWLITVLSIPGLILIVRRREPAAFFLMAVLAIYPLLYYIVVSDVRYRYPILWISALAAGYFLAQLRSWIERRSHLC